MRARRAQLGSAASLLALSLAAAPLAGCGVFEDSSSAKAKVTASTAPARAIAPDVSSIGRGPIKVALILPLTGAGEGAAAAASLRNAAELAVADGGQDLTLLIGDDRGTAEGARAATAQALGEGAELVVGPLFAPSVAAASAVARGQNRPLIAFSTDVGVAQKGTYLLSFLPQNEVERILDYAAAQGRRSIAALVPDTSYGAVVEAQFRESAARRGLRVAGLERYTPGQPGPAVARLAPLWAGDAPQIDGLLIPEAGEGLPAVGEALRAAGFNPTRVKPLGTGVWNDPRALRVASLQGGWFAAPDSAGFRAFATRYKARFGQEPNRVATLAYDAVSLAAALARTQGAKRFSEPTLQTATGFSGADGVFRFRPDGTNERALAVLQVANGATSVASAAPTTLGASGT